MAAEDKTAVGMRVGSSWLRRGARAISEPMGGGCGGGFRVWALRERGN